MAQLTTVAGTTVGSAGTLAVRQLFDQSGDTSITRPSVLFGAGVGAVSLGAWMAVERGMIDAPILSRRMFQNATYSLGVSGLATGLASAVLPKGSGGFMAPSL